MQYTRQPRNVAAVTKDDRCYFSPRHVCDALGIDWKSQHVKIMADQVLATCVVEITTQLPGTGQSRAYVMLPIEFLSGWLFTIKKVRPEVQDKLNVFRAEGFVALDAWFRKGLRHSPTAVASAAPSPTGRSPWPTSCGLRSNPQ
ncbi:phage antirepressor N-terminal domain-containing protein [Nitratidesulfovibrio sp. D1]|uniref:phage antirepressor N-terminal domain-containing protein n=1 Tax=Nitratidesulfovibrio sp. D1 TaxID=3440151 RepID=UPI003EBB4FF9